MRTRVSTSAAAFAALAVPALGAAQPVIQSVTWQKDVQPYRLVINGSGFGTRPDYGGNEPFLNKAWRNFSGESTLTPGAVIGNWVNDMTSEEVKNFSLRADARYPGSVVAHKQFPTSSYVGSEFGKFSVPPPPTPPSDWYLAWWFRMNAPNQGGKIMRHGSLGPNFWFATGGVLTYPNTDLNLRGNSEACTGCSPPPQTKWGAKDQFVAGQWAFIEVILRKVPNELTVLLDGKLQYRFKPVSDGTETHVEQWVHPDFNGLATLFNSLSDANRGYPTVGWFEGHDMYLDYSLARVILSDSAVYDPGIRHHREIQVPRQWSDSQIVVDFNQGSFANGQVVYVYVVDASGRVSAGFPITTSGQVLPSAPRNLRIIR